MSDTSNINEQIHSRGPDIKPHIPKYVATIHFETRLAVKLLEAHLGSVIGTNEPRIKVNDVHIEYEN